MYELREHQIVGRDTLMRRAAHPPKAEAWMSGSTYPKHFALFDEQRVGKCAQTLTAAAALGGRVAVVCRAIGRDTWWRERKLWAMLDLPKKDMLVMSYSELARTGSASRKRWRAFAPDIVILDECQSLKREAAQCTQVLYGATCENTGLLKNVPVVWPLSGTPAENNVGELWTHLHALWEYPYDYIGFLDRYAHWTMGDYGPKIYSVREETIEELRRFLRKISLRRLFDEVNPQIQRPVWQVVPVSTSRALAELRRLESDPTLRRRVREVLEWDLSGRELTEKEESIQYMTPLPSVRRATGMAKVPLAVEHLINLITDGAAKHVLVGALHLDVLDGVADGLRAKGFRVLQIDGRTTRTTPIQDAWLRGEAHFLVGQLQACGTSIDLSIADCAVLIETSWEPDVNAQFVFRCMHMRRTHALPVDVLALAGTSDEGVQRVITRKNIQSSLLWEHAA